MRYRSCLYEIFPLLKSNLSLFDFIVFIQEKITQLENKSLLKIRKLEEQLKDEKERYKTDVENLHKQLQDIKQQRSEVMNSRIERKSFSDGVCKASQVTVCFKNAIRN